MLVDSSTVICWTSSLKFCHIRGIGLILSLLWKILLANNIDPNQMPQYLAFDLSLHLVANDPFMGFQAFQDLVNKLTNSEMYARNRSMV